MAGGWVGERDIMTNCCRRCAGRSAGLLLTSKWCPRSPSSRMIYVELHLDADALDRAVSARFWNELVSEYFGARRLVLAAWALLSPVPDMEQGTGDSVETQEARSPARSRHSERLKILRDARLAASQRPSSSTSNRTVLAARRAERLELERGLAERRNSDQLATRAIVEAEKNLNQDKSRFAPASEVVGKLGTGACSSTDRTRAVPAAWRI